MKVLYIGEVWEGGTCLARAQVLRERGWQVATFDTTAYQRANGRIMRGLQHRLLDGPAVRRFNHDLLDVVERAQNIDIVWIDKGRWVFPSTLARIKDSLHAGLVHYTPDPAFSVHTSRHFRGGLPLYDLCITTKRYELDAYNAAGARRVVFSWQGVDDRFKACAHCSDVGGPHRSGIVFIGHRETYYAQVLSQIARKTQDLRVYGPGWEKLAGTSTILAPHIAGGGIWGQAYAETLGRASIGIGLLSKLYPDQFTTRSFEVPAAGALLLAERTAEHRELFEEGAEAEFFETTEELVEKVDFYHRNEPARVAIARRGRERVLSCFGWREVLAPALRDVEQLLAGMRPSLRDRSVRSNK